MDVNARRADVEAAEQQDVDMDEIFTMEAEDIKNCKYLWKNTYSFTQYQGW